MLPHPGALAANSHGFSPSSLASPSQTALSMAASPTHTGELAGRVKVPALSGHCGAVAGHLVPPPRTCPVQPQKMAPWTHLCHQRMEPFSQPSWSESELKTLESS